MGLSKKLPDISHIKFEEKGDFVDYIKLFRQDICSNNVSETIEETTKSRKRTEVPLWEKATLTIEEAAEFSGIGIHKIRELTDANNCKFILWNGNRRLIKRKKFEEFIDESFSI